MDLTYADISLEALNTPVQDWRLLFNYMLNNGQTTLFDAGAGHANSAQVAQKEFPNIKVFAYELVEERIKHLDCPDQVIKCVDLFETPIPKCDITYMYLPTGPLLERVLSQLENGSIIAAVESHGELFSRLEETAIQIDSLKISAKRHDCELKIYQWRKPKEDLKAKLRQWSFQKTYKQIHIKEKDVLLGDTIWTADIEGLTITPDNFVETIYPPRRLELNQVLQINEPTDVELIERRRAGEIKKIFIKPYGIIEDSVGKRHSYEY